MRITQCLWRQHLGRMTRRHWYIQSQKTPVQTRAQAILEARGIQVVDPKDVIDTRKRLEKFTFEFLVPNEIPHDENHPDWKDKPCLTYRDHNVLVEGVPQAQILTKTVEVKNELPERIESLVKDHTEEVNSMVQRAVQNSCIFDAHQLYLPKRKDPLRPAFVFPRELGLSAIKKSQNLSQKLLQIVEVISGSQTVHNRNLVLDGVVIVPIEKDGDQLKFTLTTDVMITSTNPLKPLESSDFGENTALPDLFPLHCTISLTSENVYKLDNLYPVAPTSRWKNPHTIFIHYDPETVKNLYELPVTETQILARSLLKSFTVAAASARHQFGYSVQDLPEPITVQCVQSDGQLFHFSVFQLNTLNLNGTEGIKNLWWSLPRIELYDKAMYEEGKPTFHGYNPEVFKRLFAFYNNN